ncbi:hypothetical protein R1flu_021800 [Riccia fluitans]|uniref:F-box associated domain-containing protein n=1 Tax=Riccia fluitans TaxID=41844 RepID=A0ABD1ZQE8_9MARC
MKLVNKKTFIYDSSRSAWKKASAPLPPLPTTLDAGEWICMGKSVNCKGNLYWSVRQFGDRYDQVVRAVVRCNLEREEWKVVRETFANPYLCFFLAVAFDERLLLLDWGDEEVLHPNAARRELQELGPETRLMDDKIENLSYIDLDRGAAGAFVCCVYLSAYLHTGDLHCEVSDLDEEFIKARKEYLSFTFFKFPDFSIEARTWK